MATVTHFLRETWRESSGRVSRLLVLLSAILFLGTAFLDLTHVADRTHVLATLGLSATGIARGWVWQFLTAPLMHAGVFHFVFNMLGIWVLGPPLERILGRQRFLILIVLCAEAALILFLLADKGGPEVVLGGSATVLGLLVAYAVYFPHGSTLLFGVFPLRMKHAALLLAGIELYLALGTEGSGAAHVSTLAGGIAALSYLRGGRWWAWCHRRWPARSVTLARLPELPRRRLKMPRLLSRKLICPHAACAHRGRPVIRSGSQAQCEGCGGPMPRWMAGRRNPRWVAVLGTSRAGKTTWLMHAFAELRQSVLEARFALPGQEEQFQTVWKALRIGKATSPTAPIPGAAWALDLPGNQRHQSLAVYDLSGEDIGDRRRLARYRCLRHLDGLVLVVDPFSLPAVAKLYAPALRVLRPPPEPAARALGDLELATLVETLSAYRAHDSAGLEHLAVAIVVTKLDLLGVDRFFKEPDPALAPARCRRQLEAWGMGNVLALLETRFARLQYFAPRIGACGVQSPANSLLWLTKT